MSSTNPEPAWEVVPLDAADAAERAVAALRAGRLLALPTDTVYGLAAAIDRPAALARIFVAKGRPAERILPVLLADPAALPFVAGTIDRRVLALAAHFWPGPLTVAVPARTGLPASLVAPDGTVGVRVPAHNGTRRVIAAAGGALAVTSANRSGAPPARTPAEVLAQLTDPAPLGLLLDGGPAPGGVPSTVVAFADGEPRLIREGAIPAAAILTACQAIATAPDSRRA